MELVAFALAYAAVVASWPRSQEEAVMWCGEREFPMASQAVADWQRDDEVRAHLLMAGDAPVGYGELWLDAQEKEVETGPDHHRARCPRKGGWAGPGSVPAGRGGQDRLSGCFHGVHPDNGIALRCYQGAGFVAVDASLAQAWNTGQPVSYVAPA